MGQAEHLADEIQLAQGLTAADGDAAVVAPIVAVAVGGREGLLRGLGGVLGKGPGLGVMAVLAAHGAALHKNNIPHARPIDQAKGFDRMDVAQSFGHRLPPLFLYWCVGESGI